MLSQSRELGPRWCEQLGHVHSVVWLHDTISEADVTDEAGTGKYVPSGVPYVPVVIPQWSKGAMFHAAHNCTAPFACFQGDRSVSR